GIENFQDVFVTLSILGPFDIGMSQFVDQDNGWLASQNAIEVHLLENRAFILHFLARQGFQLLRELKNPLSPVGLYDSDDDVLAPAFAANGFAQHVVSLADTRRVTEK